jgi:cytochrome c
VSGPGALVLWAIVCLAAFAARAQMTLPQSLPPPDRAGLFATQCATCHSLDPAEPRQGPMLAHVFGRHAGSVAGFKYSPGFAGADFVWDDAHLDAWLADPQKLIPGSVMLYRQPDAATRRGVIAWLKEQH